MNITTIIEKKKEEFERRADTMNNDSDFIVGCYECGESINRDNIKSFIEKSIKESVEEALREVRPQPGYTKTNWKTCLDEFDNRVKEFMK